jgi:hypothetical protein
VVVRETKVLSKVCAMEFAFPPAPQDYSVVIVARCLLVAWSLTGVAIVAIRLRRWKSVRPTEIQWWGAAAAISCVVALLGMCKYTVYDNNDWNIPALTAAVSVSIAGITVCLYKIATEGTHHEKRTWIGGTVGTGIAIWLVLFLVFFTGGVGDPGEYYRRTECKNNLKVIGLAMHNFHDERDAFPPPESGTPLISWRVTLLPYLDQHKVYTRYDQKAEWNQAPNLALARIQIRALSCPASYQYQGDDEMYDTAYSMLTGPQTVGGNPGGTRLRDIKDGASNTAMVVEACGAQINWSEPRDVNIADQPAGINLKGQRPGHSKGWLSSFHSRGAHILQADGAVRFVSSETDPGVLQNLAKMDDAPVLDDL